MGFSHFMLNSLNILRTFLQSFTVCITFRYSMKSIKRFRESYNGKFVLKLFLLCTMILISVTLSRLHLLYLWTKMKIENEYIILESDVLL